MHKADIKAALEKRGLTLTELGRRHGYTSWAMSETLRRGRPKIEKVIADALDTTPQKLFPKRFHPDGRRKNKRIDQAAKRKSLISDSNTDLTNNDSQKFTTKGKRKVTDNSPQSAVVDS